MCLFNTYMSMTLNFNCSVLVFLRNMIQFYFLRIDIILDGTRKSKVSSQLWTVNMQWSWPPSWVMVTLNERAAPAPKLLALISTGIRFSLRSLHSLCFVKMVLQALGFSPNLFLGTDRSPVELGNCKKGKRAKLSFRKKRRVSVPGLTKESTGDKLWSQGSHNKSPSVPEWEMICQHFNVKD